MQGRPSHYQKRKYDNSTVVKSVSPLPLRMSSPDIYLGSQENLKMMLRYKNSINRVLRKFVPDWVIEDFSSPEEILMSIEDSLEDFIMKIKEDQMLDNSSDIKDLKKTSQNLLRYEKLLNSKKEELEIEMENWEIQKKRETEEIEKLQDDLKKNSEFLEKKTWTYKTTIDQQDRIIEDLKENISSLENIVLKERIENENLKWKLEQQQRVTEEKEAIMGLKMEMINEEQKSMIFIKSEAEKMKIAYRTLEDELFRCKSQLDFIENRQSPHLSVHKRIKSDTKFSVSDSSLAEKQDNMVAELLSSFEKEIHFINTAKKSLEDSQLELNSLRGSIIPELRRYSEEVIDLFNELSEKKEDLEKNLENLNEILEKYSEKIKELDTQTSSVHEKLEDLSKREQELENTEKHLNLKKKSLEASLQDFEIENTKFSEEKIEFLEEVTQERAKFEKYYDDINNKIAMLNFKQDEINLVRQVLTERENLIKIKEYELKLTTSLY